MDQENNFLKYYESLTQEEIDDEIMTLNNIRLSVDFWEYIATDPEKLLAIIHYNQLEEKYGIKIVFDNKRKSATIDPDDLCKDCPNCQELTALRTMLRVLNTRGKYSLLTQMEG